MRVFTLYNDTGVVIDQMTISGDPSPPSGWTDTTDSPPPFLGSVPQQIANADARVVLSGMPGPADGVTMLDAINAACKQAGGATFARWEYGNFILRDSVFVAQIAGAFGWTSGQVDDLFRAAAQLTG